MGKLVCGVGVSEKGKWKRSVRGVETKEYTAWCNMLKRCYSVTYLEKQPSYEGCSVSDNFKNFQYFAEWYNSQKGFDCENFQLDKDLLAYGNRVYSEEYCSLLPREVNMFLSIKKKAKGDYPVGVTFDKSTNRFLSAIRFRGKSVHIGRYDTSEEAFHAYKVKKVSLARFLADEYKTHIDKRAHQALLNFNLEIIV